jgi:hypothetical protein
MTKAAIEAMPKVGEIFSDLDLHNYADRENYEVKRIGNNENGEMLLVLSNPGMPSGMTFLLTKKGSLAPFVRVY